MTDLPIDLFTAIRYPWSMPRKPARKKQRPMVKTSLELPEDLWKAAKVRAVEQRVDFRSVIIAALEEYLGIKLKARA